jgi:hypothetical protein
MYHYFRGLLIIQETVPISFLSENTNKTDAKDDLLKFLDRYRLILKLQTEVNTFLVEKFTSNSRIDYVQDTMKFVQDQIKILENELKLRCENGEFNKWEITLSRTHKQ